VLDLFLPHHVDDLDPAEDHTGRVTVWNFDIGLHHVLFPMDGPLPLVEVPEGDDGTNRSTSTSAGKPLLNAPNDLH
jgi:hypothetical protein